MAWKDQRGTLIYGIGVDDPILEAVGTTTDWLVPWFRNNRDGVINVSFPMSHEWDPRRTIRPHMIFIPGAAGTGNVRLLFRYAWVKIGQGFPAGAGFTEIICDIPIVPADLHRQQILKIGALTAPVGTSEGDLFAMQIRRPGLSDLADTYKDHKAYGTPLANLAMPIANIKFEPVKAGTFNEFGPT
jgi:hypothetical protein